jgi:hypothetical protein
MLNLDPLYRMVAFLDDMHHIGIAPLDSFHILKRMHNVQRWQKRRDTGFIKQDAENVWRFVKGGARYDNPYTWVTTEIEANVATKGARAVFQETPFRITVTNTQGATVEYTPE